MNLIKLTNIGDVTASLEPSAFTLKANALALASTCEAVTGPTDLFLCVGAIRAIKVVLKGMEDTRKSLKGPVLEVGRKIDGIALDFCHELEKERTRLEALQTAFAREQDRLAVVAAQKRQEEIQRIAAHSQEAAKAVMAVPVAAPVRTAGLVVTKRWTFKVINIRALSVDRPQLCRIKASTSEINKAIAAGMRECPGLEIFEEITTGTRS